MITFKQFLREESLPHTPHEIANLIRENCREYLNAMPSCGLWRGFASSTDARPIQIKTVRKDRQPLSTAKELHADLDAVFLAHTGIKFRSQALFTSPSALEAASYGDEFLIFPIGQIDYCWSPEIKDLFAPSHVFPTTDTVLTALMVEVVTRQFPDRIKTKSPSDIFFDLGTSARGAVLVEVIDQNFDKLYKFNRDLAKNNDAFKGHEVMISCDKYYAVEKTIAREVLKLI